MQSGVYSGIIEYGCNTRQRIKSRHVTMTSLCGLHQILWQPTWCLRIFALLAGALVRATRRPIRKQTSASEKRSIFLL